jgi:hypothetical protein
MMSEKSYSPQDLAKLGNILDFQEPILKMIQVKHVCGGETV